jgi:UDP-glucuronate decarboxylase
MGNPYIQLMRHDASLPLYVGADQIYNDELTENDLRLTSNQSTLTFKPLPTDDPRQRQPDITLAKATLNWEPKVPLATA